MNLIGFNKITILGYLDAFMVVKNALKIVIAEPNKGKDDTIYNTYHRCIIFREQIIDTVTEERIKTPIMIIGTVQYSTYQHNVHQEIKMPSISIIIEQLYFVDGGKTSKRKREKNQLPDYDQPPYLD